MNAFRKYLLIPIEKSLSRRKYFSAKAYQKVLEGLEYRSYDELKDCQFNNLKIMLRHAYSNVKYYRDLFKRHDIIPTDIKDYSDISRLPFLTKDILVRNLEDMVDSKCNRAYLKYISTGGTTGTPINFYRDQRFEYRIDGNNWRFFKYCGYELGEGVASLWGNENDLKNSLHLRGYLKSKIENVSLLNFYDLNKQRLDHYVDYMVCRKPLHIKGFTSAVLGFMRHLKRYNRSIPQPKSVIITSDKVDSHELEEVRDYFNNNVYNEYGCREFSILGFECNQHNGIHLGMENNLVEVIPLKDSPDVGTIVVTSLTNFGMPFIRYQLGDNCTILDHVCKCGRSLPLIGDILGRIADFVVTKSDKLIYGDFFAHLLYNTKGIEHYRVHQKEKGEIYFYIEPNEYFINTQLDNINSDLKSMVGDDLSCNFIIVDNIEKHSSGKRRSVTSEISRSYL